MKATTKRYVMLIINIIITVLNLVLANIEKEPVENTKPLISYELEVQE